MRLRKEASLGISTMLTLQILLSILAITLLERMGPAIEKIIQENVYSAEAVEVMLAQLALGGGNEQPVTEDFVKALERAKANVTEEAEGPLLSDIEAYHREAFVGNEDAREIVINALRELGKVNRDSMILADEQAKRLSQTGAWGAALLGAVALFLAIVVYRQLRLRLEVPIEHLHRTTERIRAGNLQARCAINTGPVEVQRIGTDINWLLDRIALADETLADERDHDRELEIRKTLGWLLDRHQHAALIIDEEGHKVACNRKALDLDLATLDELDESKYQAHKIEKTVFRFIEIHQDEDQSGSANDADEEGS